MRLPLVEILDYAILVRGLGSGRSLPCVSRGDAMSPRAPTNAAGNAAGEGSREGGSEGKRESLSQRGKWQCGQRAPPAPLPAFNRPLNRALPSPPFRLTVGDFRSTTSFDHYFRDFVQTKQKQQTLYLPNPPIHPPMYIYICIHV